jgi:hypothetical protein
MLLTLEDELASVARLASSRERSPSSGRMCLFIRDSSSAIERTPSAGAAKPRSHDSRWSDRLNSRERRFRPTFRGGGGPLRFSVLEMEPPHLDLCLPMGKDRR